MSQSRVSPKKNESSTTLPILGIAEHFEMKVIRGNRFGPKHFFTLMISDA